MNKESKQNISQLFDDILSGAYIEYSAQKGVEAYVAYDERGIIFGISLNKTNNTYYLYETDLLKSEYEKHKISPKSVKDYKYIYLDTSLIYNIREIVLNTNNDINSLFKTILFKSDIIFHMNEGFESYFVINSGLPVYNIGHNPNTHQYGMNRYLMANTLCKICGIPQNIKPDYKKLYKMVKDQYMANTVIETMCDFEIEY